MNLPPLIAIGFLIGAAAGWHFRDGLSDTTAFTENHRISPRQARARQATQKPGIPDDIAARLAPIHAAKSPAERLRAVIHLANTLPVSELARWYDNKWFDSRKDADAEVFAEITRNRWLDEDPEGLIDHVLLRNWPNAEEVAERWARLGPDRALAYFENRASPADRERLEMATLAGFAESRPELVLAAAADVLNMDYQWREVLEKIARHHPSTLEDATMPHRLKLAARDAILTVALERDFIGEINRTLGRGDDLSAITFILENDPAVGIALSSTLLARLGSLPVAFLEELGGVPYYLVFQDPAAWLAADLSSFGMSPTAAQGFHEAAIARLSRADPEEALRHLARFDFEVGGFSAVRTQSALLRLKTFDPEKAAEWQARILADAPDENFVTRFSKLLEEPEAIKPKTAQAIVDQFDAHTASDRSHRLISAFKTAPISARVEFEAWLGSMDSEKLAAYAHKLDPEGLPPGLQAHLLRAALQHPQEVPREMRDYTPAKAANLLAQKWGGKDPVAASRWAASLPTGEARTSVLRTLVTSWAPYDTPAANAWITRLPAADQADIREFLKIGPPK